MNDVEAEQLLELERVRALSRIGELTREFDGIVLSSADSNADDEHDPEGSTIAFERAQLAAMLSRARSHLAEVDAARQRLREGNYGVCARCGGRIAPDRLRARPAASTCVVCAASATGEPTGNSAI